MLHGFAFLSSASWAFGWRVFALLFSLPSPYVLLFMKVAWMHSSSKSIRIHRVLFWYFEISKFFRLQSSGATGNSVCACVDDIWRYERQQTHSTAELKKSTPSTVKLLFFLCSFFSCRKTFNLRANKQWKWYERLHHFYMQNERIGCAWCLNEVSIRLSNTGVEASAAEFAVDFFSLTLFQLFLLRQLCENKNYFYSQLKKSFCCFARVAPMEKTIKKSKRKKWQKKLKNGQKVKIKWKL